MNESYQKQLIANCFETIRYNTAFIIVFSGALITLIIEILGSGKTANYVLIVAIAILLTGIILLSLDCKNLFAEARKRTEELKL